ncbi:MAG: hypothetical protein ABL889_19710, partial [Terricaulis sp.]
VLLSTHIVSDVEATAARIVVMGQGKLLSQGTPEALLDSVRGRVWELELPASELDALMPKLSTEIDALEAKLAAPDAFNAADFSKTAARLEAARAERDTAEAEWLELELRREALSAQE